MLFLSLPAPSHKYNLSPATDQGSNFSLKGPLKSQSSVYKDYLLNSLSSGLREVKDAGVFSWGGKSQESPV